MLQMSTQDDLSWLASTLVSDAVDGRGIVQPGLLTSMPDVHVVGPALTVTVTVDDNSPVRELSAMRESPVAAGTVLVVGGASASRTAVLGDLVARELAHLGFAAVVTDGLVRDAAEIRRIGFPVWARGVTPAASRKEGTGRIGGGVVLGGVFILDGDVIVADSDGVICVPARDLAAVTVRAQEKKRSDEQRLARLEGGSSS